MAFIRFVGDGKRYGSAPALTIWKRGQFSFNNEAVKSFHIEKFAYVVLYYDGAETKIGVDFTNEKREPGAIKLHSRNGGGTNCSAIPFLKAHNINYTKTRKYKLYHDRDVGLFIADLATQRPT